MGACFSSKSSLGKPAFNHIRVVHMNGFLEDYEDPATVDQVIGNFPKHFMCTPVQLLQTGLTPLKLDTQLKSGQIYFLLPNSTLRFDASPVDLASLTRKLTNIAKTGRCEAKSAPASPSASPCSSPGLNKEARTVSRFSDHCGINGAEDMWNSSKSPSWKPILATIREMSFNRRTESDLQD